MILLFAVDLCFCPHKDIWGEVGTTRLATDRKPALYLLGSLSDRAAWPQGRYMVKRKKEQLLASQSSRCKSENWLLASAARERGFVAWP